MNGAGSGFAQANPATKDATAVKSWSFTLLELIIVLTIIAALVGGSVPLFRRTLSDLQLSEAADRFTALLSFARQMAILKKAECRISIDTDNKQYWLSKTRIYSIPKAVDINTEQKLIPFYGDGASIDAIVNFSSGKKALAVKIDAVSGAAQIIEDEI